MRYTFYTVILALLSTVAIADDKPVYDRVSFTISAEKEVDNDLQTAVVFAEEQGSNTATLADTVNQTITWAMSLAKKETTIESRTLNYSTNPIYKDSRIAGWQVRQSIQLKSKDSKALSALLGKLQEKLRIEGVGYSISPEVRTNTEEELITSAIAKFKQRAEQVKSNMSRSDYRVVKLDVQSGENFQPQMFRNAVFDTARMSEVAAPTLDGGKHTVRVNVQAEIELAIN